MSHACASGAWRQSRTARGSFAVGQAVPTIHYRGIIEYRAMACVGPRSTRLCHRPPRTKAPGRHLNRGKRLPEPSARCVPPDPSCHLRLRDRKRPQRSRSLAPSMNGVGPVVPAGEQARGHAGTHLSVPGCPARALPQRHGLRQGERSCASAFRQSGAIAPDPTVLSRHAVRRYAKVIGLR